MDTMEEGLETTTEATPAPRTRRSEWLDARFDGRKWVIREASWHGINPDTGEPRYATIKSAQSSINEAAKYRGIELIECSIRGDVLRVQAKVNGRAPRKAAAQPAKKAVAKKATTKKAAAKKAAPRKGAHTQ